MAYAGMHNPLQQEWAFVKRISLGVRELFQIVEDSIKEAFMPTLLQGWGTHTTGHKVTQPPDKKSGLALTNPTMYEPDN